MRVLRNGKRAWGLALLLDPLLPALGLGPEIRNALGKGHDDNC